MPKMHKKVFDSKKMGKKTFFTKKNKTIEACQELSKTPKNRSNGSKLAKKSQIFVRGGALNY